VIIPSSKYAQPRASVNIGIIERDRSHAVPLGTGYIALDSGGDSLNLNAATEGQLRGLINCSRRALADLK